MVPPGPEAWKQIFSLEISGPEWSYFVNFRCTCTGRSASHASWMIRPWRWSSHIGCQLSKEFHKAVSVHTPYAHRTSATTLSLVRLSTGYPQFLPPVADRHTGGWGRLAQRCMFCQEQKLDLENAVSSILWASRLEHFSFRPSRHYWRQYKKENDSRVYFLIMLSPDYWRRSWTCRILAPANFLLIDWLIDCRLPILRSM